MRLPKVAVLNPRRFSNELADSEVLSFVPMKCVEEESGRLHAGEVKTWRDVKKGYTPFEDGDVIFAKITPCMENGKYALASGLNGGRAAGSTEFHVFRPSPELNSKYLLFFLFSPEVRRAAKGNMRGAAGQLRVPTIFFEELEIPVPPLDEQKRIVAELEKQFTRLEAGVASLKRVRAALKRYRASVLKAACEGHLVPTEAELARRDSLSYEPATTLLARILSERREHWTGRGKYKEPAPPGTKSIPPLPEGWALASLEQLTSANRPICYGILMPKENVLTGVLYVKVKDMKGDRIDVGSLHRTTPEIASKYTRASLQTGDLLLAIRGTYGRVAEAPRELDGGNITQDTARLDVVPRVSHRYVATCLRNTDCQNYFKRVARGVAVKGVNIAEVKTTPIAFPPLAEQLRIVAEMERRLSVIEELEAVVAANLLRATRLRQSILDQAFRGALTKN